MVVLVPSAPMNDERLSTAGSARITLASSCCFCAMAFEPDRLRRLRDALDDARVLHREEALGDDDVQKMVSTSVATATSSVMVWYRRTNFSVRP